MASERNSMSEGNQDFDGNSIYQSQARSAKSRLTQSKTGGVFELKNLDPEDVSKNRDYR